jgi:hypothetical protein
MIAASGAVAAAEDRNIPALGDCAWPDAAEQLRIEKLLPDGAGRFGCADPDGVIVEQTFVRMKGTERDKGVWRVVRVKGKKVTKLAEVTGTPEVDWQEYAQENTLGVVVLADVDGDGKRDAVLEETSTEGGVHHHTSVIRLVKSGAARATKLGELTEVVATHVAAEAKPGRVVITVDPYKTEDKSISKCVTAKALTECKQNPY